MQAPQRVAVVGATGRVGSHLVGVLAERGHDVVAISRAKGVDVITGAGLAQALEGVDSVVDAATSPLPDEQTATEFFVTAAGNLQKTGARAGVRRIVVVSIIGTDRWTHGYGAAKNAHERATLEGPIPARLLRAAQFHEFVAQLVDWGRRGDVAFVPRARMQLVAARSVADALADLVTSEEFDAADSRIPEIAGPREENLVDAARLLVARRGDPVRIEGVSDADDEARDIYESGGLLPSPHALLAGPAFAEWLEVGSRVGVAGA